MLQALLDSYRSFLNEEHQGDTGEDLATMLSKRSELEQTLRSKRAQLIAVKQSAQDLIDGARATLMPHAMMLLESPPL